MILVCVRVGGVSNREGRGCVSRRDCGQGGNEGFGSRSEHGYEQNTCEDVGVWSEQVGV